MIHYQEWNYKLNMVKASRKGAPVVFSRVTMEGMFWEEIGFVQASLFPQLCRLEESVEDDVEEDETEDDDENEEDDYDEQDHSYTVICKARVSVVNDWKDDMEDAEDIEVKIETGSKSPESPRERAMEKSVEDIDLERKPDSNQSGVRDENLEKDVGEPMDVDSVSGLPGKADNPRTPDRKVLEIIIPDSVD